jgi:hypothetical protein
MKVEACLRSTMLASHPVCHKQFAPGDHDRLSARFVITKGRAWLEDSTYHPEFGCSIRNLCLVVELEHAESVVAFTF